MDVEEFLVGQDCEVVEEVHPGTWSFYYHGSYREMYNVFHEYQANQCLNHLMATNKKGVDYLHID